ncbi:MAG: hypothetical protein AAGU32_10840 [Bacillota bacterium]
MKEFLPAIMGGDPFCDAFRGLYDPHCYWKLTDPEYCLTVMRGAYEGGCRAFDYSFPNVQDMFMRLRESADEPVVGVANPTYLQGVTLAGRQLQYCRSRIIKTLVEDPAFLTPEISADIRDNLRNNACMVFGYDIDAIPLSDKEIGAIQLDEDIYRLRLDGLKESTYVLIGGTDADWLFSLGREDIIERMGQLVRARGQRPVLICHYASTVLPRADLMGLDVEAYFAPINKSWSWFSLEDSQKAVREAKKPVIAFMAFACGGLKDGMRAAAEYLRDACGVSGVLFGTTKPQNAKQTAAMLLDVFGH